MARSAPRGRPQRHRDDNRPLTAPDDDSPPAGTDAEDWAQFLADVGAAEQTDPDEPERWERFFARLRALLSVVEGRDA